MMRLIHQESWELLFMNWNFYHFTWRSQTLNTTTQDLPVIISDEVDSDAEVSITTWSTDAMQVRLRVLWEVKVNDDIHSLDINASRK